MQEKKVRWSKPAKEQFAEAIEYILNDSVQNAEKFEKKLWNAIKKAVVFPESCAPDKHKTDNDGSYRAFVVYRYRVSYRIQRRDKNITDKTYQNGT